MAVAAPAPMSVAAFLEWEGDPDVRYELWDGVPVAMAPPSSAHGLLVARLVVRFDAALAERPECSVRVEAAVASAEGADRLWIPDLVVTCRPLEPGERVTPEPVLVVEVLSPSTEDRDRKVKLPDYRRLPSVREILLVDAARPWLELHRRLDSGIWRLDLLHRPEDRLLLESVPLTLTVGDLYHGVPTAETRA